eukprot:TRINITY_DN62180_c0_g1_i1.p1 TRINITY_DN62180_c0_g1~~TRINITY_DN62180_c0_g1_i1.p1  ORF type:complete len:509 (+),score=102.94 TRINITY_DN62180_c0_g1_i1:99-1529(+)
MAAGAAPVPAGCEVRQANPSKGFGLFATATASPGAQVFTDQPLFVIQHTGNRRVVAACARCCGFVGSLGVQLETLFNEERFASLWGALGGPAGAVVAKWQTELGLGPAAGSSVVRCAQGCGELYCSEACRDAHFVHSHNLLCTGPIQNGDHPLLRFKYHALEHADTLLLAAQVMAFLVNRARASGGGAQAMQGLMSELLAFCHAPFRDACRAPPGRSKDAEFLAHTDNLIQEAAQHLKAALDLHAPEEAAVLFAAGPAFLSEILGMFEFNNIDVEVPSPISGPLLAKGRALFAASATGDAQAAAELALLEQLLREKEWVMQCVCVEETTGIFGDDEEVGGDAMMGAEVDDDRDDAEVANTAMAEARRVVNNMTIEQLLLAAWPALHGTALFATVARINHSCAPNTKIVFPSNSACLNAVALTPVAAGDEICISYIQQEADVHVRRRRLLEYGFVCNCPLCQQQDSGETRKTQRRLK